VITNHLRQLLSVFADLTKKNSCIDPNSLIFVQQAPDAIREDTTFNNKIRCLNRRKFTFFS
jgi:hypothetical protein